MQVGAKVRSLNVGVGSRACHTVGPQWVGEVEGGNPEGGNPEALQ